MIKATVNLKDGRKIDLELLPEYAPNSVYNFISLAKSGFYNGLIFHRVIRNFMIQGGGMDEGMDEKDTGYSIKGEFASNGVPNALSHKKGVLSMARTFLMDSASSQFFICVADCPYLDGEYAAFGRTANAESLKVAVDISNVDTGSYGYYDDVPVEPVIIDSIVVEDGDYPSPQKINA